MIDSNTSPFVRARRLARARPPASVIDVRVDTAERSACDNESAFKGGYFRRALLET